MKVKVTQQMIDQILNDPDKAKEAGVKVGDPWWVIVLKVVAYAIGLILGGALTTSCANLAGII